MANANDTNPLNNSDPAVIRAGVTAVNGFDLSLKKYVNGSDAQANVNAVDIASNTGFTYTLEVRNE